MTAFRLLLIAQLVALTIYTFVVGTTEGWNFWPDYFGILGEWRWPGQFAADFTVFLTLTGLWAAWRNHFSAGGIVLGLVAMMLGTGFLATYLLYLSWHERGDVPRMLVGDRIGDRRMGSAH